MGETVYLDHAAATPLDKRVFAAMRPFFDEAFYNPTAAYQPAREVRAAYESARHRLAMCIGGAKEEIILTAGATESVNLAIHGVLAGGGHAVIGATEHAAVRGAVEPYTYSTAPADAHGLVRSEAIRDQIREDTRLISVALADSELGTVQKLRDVAQLVSEIRAERLANGNKTPLYFHSDASQGAGLLDINVARLGVDLLTLNAGKIYGPKQVGLLWARRGIVLEPLIRGGGQERGIRSGTENVAGAVGFAVALEQAQQDHHQENYRLTKLRDEMQRRLELALPDLAVNGHLKRRLASHLHVGIAGLDAERVVFGLEARGVLVATGAACAANKGTRSAVLTAVGMDEALADGSLRLTLGHLTDEASIERVVPIIIEVINEERSR